MLEPVDLSRRFGDTLAVAHASLTIRLGEMVGIIGRSGAGKSTLLRLINRPLELTGGRITADGAGITALHGAALRACTTKASHEGGMQAGLEHGMIEAWSRGFPDLTCDRLHWSDQPGITRRHPKY